MDLSGLGPRLAGLPRVKPAEGSARAAVAILVQGPGEVLLMRRIEREGDPLHVPQRAARRYQG